MDTLRSHTRNDAINTSYNQWRSQRSQLFGQTPQNTTMTTNGIAHVSATAEGRDEAVVLRVRWDGSLDRSIISQTQATALAGRLARVEAAILTDAGGEHYSSNTGLEIRWHYEDTPQTFGETFYVVKDCGPYDAMLSRHTCAPGESTLTAYPILLQPRKAKEREEQKRKEAEASMRREHESRAQVAKIRENIAATRKHQSVR